MNLFQLVKNLAISLICSGDTTGLRILQSEWLAAFWSIPQELHFFQICDLSRNTAININFYIRAN